MFSAFVIARLVLLTVAIFLTLESHAADILWTNLNGGLWNAATNWSPNRVPNAADNALITNNGTYTVTINFNNATNNTLTVGGTAGSQTLLLAGGTLIVNGAATINPNGVFEESSGVLTGNGDLSIKGTLIWSSGSILGAGKVSIANGAVAILGTFSTKGLARTIDNAGTVNYTGTGLRFGEQNVVTLFNNRPGGVFNVTGDGDFSVNFGGAHALNNEGTFTKSGPGTLTTFNGVAFNNRGTVNFTSGALTLNSGGTNSTNLEIPAAATLNLNGTFNHALTGTAITGAGTINFNGGTHNFVGQFLPTGTVNFNSGTITIANTINPAVMGPITATVNFNAPQSFPNLTLNGGTISGSGNVTIAGALSWPSGYFLGTGRLLIATGATATLNGQNTKGLARTLDNSGTVNYPGNGLRFGEQNVVTVFNNLAGGVVNVSDDGDFTVNFGGAHAFNNAGTFNKEGIGTTTTFSGVAFNNSGAVNLTAGTLEFNSGGNSSVNFNVPAGTTLNLNGAFTFNGGGSLSGGGRVNFNGSTYTFANNFALTGPLIIANATMAFNAPTRLDSIILSGGVLSGTGDVTITGALTWSGGNMLGTGKTLIATGAVAILNTESLKGLGRTIENSGTVTYTGSGLRFGEQDVTTLFNNLPGGVFNVTGDGDFNSNFGGPHALNNKGTFNKSGAGTLTTFSGVAFNNQATVNFTGGTLTLNAGGTNSSNLEIPAGATLNLNGTFNHALTGTAITGAGTINFNGGTHNFVGQFLPSGTVNFNSGTITIANPISPAVLGPITATVIFNAPQSYPNLTLNGGTISGSGDLTITAAFTWSYGYLFGPGRVIIAPGAMALLNTANLKGFTRTIDNFGTVNYTGNGLRFGEQDVVTLFNNQASGVVNVTGDGDFNSNFGGAHAFNNAGTFNKNGVGITTTFSGVAFNNTGAVNFTAGTLELNSGGNSSANLNVQPAATLNLNGVFTFNGGGSLSGGGRVNFNGGTHTFTNNFALTSPLAIANATLVFTAPTRLGSVILSGGVLSGSGDITITGALNWSGGSILGSGRLIITNGATATLSGFNLKGLTRTIDNAGTVNYTGSGLRFGEQNVVTLFNNLHGGIVNVTDDGDFSVNFGGAHAFNNDGTFNKSGAGSTTTFNGVAFNNRATVNFTAGTLTLFSGGTNSSNLEIPAGATLNLNNTFNHAIAGTALTGAGTINFNTGTHNFIGQFLPSGTVNFNSGTITIANPISPAALGPIAANVVFNVPQSFPNVTLNGGTLSGGGDVTITGALNWPSGSFFGPGRLIIASGAIATLSSQNFKGLTRMVENSGTVNYVGSNWRFASQDVDTIFNNLPGGVVNVPDDGDFDISFSGAHAFNNAGTFNKSGLSTITDFNGVPFNNTGVIRLTSGSLETSFGLIFSGGAALQSAQNATLRISAGNLTGGSSNSSQWAAQGRLFFEGGTHQFEVMSRDLGNLPSGYVNNFAYGTIELAPGANVSLVDITDSVPGVEAVYADALIVPSGATLNLNGLRLYARVSQISGTTSGSTTPIITQQPVDQTVAAGGSVVLQVAAIPLPLSYQWKRNGVNLPGETNSTLSLTGIGPSGGGLFSVIVANQFDAVSSRSAVVTVQSPALPFADDFASAGLLLAASGFGSSNNFGATKQLGEPNHAGKPGGRSIWINWVAPQDGIVTFSTEGTSFDTVLAAYIGASVSALTEVASDDDGGPSLSSRISFRASAGTVYHIAVDSFSRVEGPVVLTWQFEATTDTPPVIVTHPSNQVVVVFGAAQFRVVVAPNAGVIRYQWFFNGTPLAGATTETLTFASVSPSDAGSYFVRVSVGSRSTDSRSATLQLVQGNVPDAGLAGNKFADVTSDAQPTGPVGLKNRIKSVAKGFTGTQLFSTVGSTTEPGEPNHCGVIGGASYWFAYQAPTNGFVLMTTEGSSFDTVLAIYTGPGDDFATLVPLACDNSSGADGRDSKTAFPVTTGTIYWVAVDGVGGVSGSVVLNWSLLQPPVITLQPTSRSVVPGVSTTFNVAATGSAPLTYQWRFNTNNIPGANGTSYTVNNVQLTNGGNYSVVVSNAATSVTSSVAQLTVSVLFELRAATKTPNGIRFTVATSPNLTFTVQASTSLTNWQSLLTTNSATGLYDFTDTNTANFPNRFYRALRGP